MSHIFLSYSAEDRDRVRPLVTLLGEVAPVWWDQAVRHGENWEIAVETAVEQAACVVVAWTRQSVKSSWVRSEAADARDRAILIPAMLEDVKVPLAFRHLQTAQLQDWNGDREHPQAQALKAAVAAVMARGAPSAAAVAPPSVAPALAAPRQVAREATALRQPRRWFRGPTALLLGLLVLVLLVAVIAMLTWRLGKHAFDYAADRLSRVSESSGSVAGPLATPETSEGISASVPSATTAAANNPAAGKVVGLLATDTATADLASALSLSSFDYLVDRDGRTVATVAKVPGDGRVRIGVVHGPPWIVSPYQPYTDAEIASLVALLTRLAHDKGVDLASVDFGDDPKLSELAERGNEVRDRAAKLLEAWRSSGVMPDEARLIVGSPTHSTE